MVKVIWSQNGAIMLSRKFNELETGDRVYLKDEHTYGYVAHVKFDKESGLGAYQIFDENGVEYEYYGTRDIAKQEWGPDPLMDSVKRELEL